MRNGYNIFAVHAERISEHYPGLAFSLGQDGVPEITGSIDLVDETMGVLDTYWVRIIPTVDYPKEFPLVYEIGGRLPKNLDWHIYPDTGSCCIKNKPEEMLICNNGITLVSFIKEEVVPYFFNQRFRYDNGYFKNEWAHGLQGNLAFFEEKFRTKDIDQILKYLKFVKNRVEPFRTEKCFCGSRLKYRKCHRDAYREVSRFTDEQLKVLIEYFFEYWLKRN